jgi:drug/metabolite transporter (DMT)-like permease
LGKFWPILRRRSCAPPQNNTEEDPLSLLAIALQETESKFLSAIKLLMSIAVIHVNTSICALLRGRILSPEHHGFNHPTFLVLAANLLSFLLAAVICRIRLYNARTYRARKRIISVSGKPAATVAGIGKVPLVQFALLSFSDCLGRNLQLYTRSTTTFPLQMVGRSSRVLPTMLLGRFLLKTNTAYTRRDFLEASVLSAAVAVFALFSRAETATSKSSDAPDHHHHLSDDDTATTSGSTFLGLVTTAGYSFCDAFTWTWQSRIYRTHHVDQYTVMLWLNACQMGVLGAFHLLSGGGYAAVAFLSNSENRGCLYQIVNLAFCSAVSQLMALYIIRRFGPVAFTALMSARQLIAVVVSALLCIGAWALDVAICQQPPLPPTDGPTLVPDFGGDLDSNLGVAACVALGPVRRAVPTASIAVALAVLGSWIHRSAPLKAEMLSRPAEITVDQWGGRRGGGFLFFY